MILKLSDVLVSLLRRIDVKLILSEVLVSLLRRCETKISVSFTSQEV